MEATRTLSHLSPHTSHGRDHEHVPLTSARQLPTGTDTWELLVIPDTASPDPTTNETDDAALPSLAADQEVTQYGIVTVTHTVSAARLPLFALALDAFTKSRCTSPLDLPQPDREHTYKIRAARIPRATTPTLRTDNPYATVLDATPAADWAYLSDALTTLTTARNNSPRHSRNTATETTDSDDAKVATYQEQKEQATSAEAVFDAGVANWLHGVRLRNRIQIMLDGNTDCGEFTVYDIADAIHASPESVSTVFAPAFAAVQLGAPLTIPGVIDASVHTKDGLDPVSIFAPVTEIEETARNTYDPGRFAALTLRNYNRLAENPNDPIETFTPDL